jgi:hypothetical protein
MNAIMETLGNYGNSLNLTKKNAEMSGSIILMYQNENWANYILAPHQVSSDFLQAFFDSSRTSVMSAVEIVNLKENILLKSRPPGQ